MAKTGTQMSQPEASVDGAVGRDRQRFAALCAAEAVWLVVLAWMAIRS
jgi:hypothetical protein